MSSTVLHTLSCCDVINNRAYHLSLSFSPSPPPSLSLSLSLSLSHTQACRLIAWKALLLYDEYFAKGRQIVGEDRMWNNYCVCVCRRNQSDGVVPLRVVFVVCGFGFTCFSAFTWLIILYMVLIALCNYKMYVCVCIY